MDHAIYVAIGRMLCYPLRCGLKSKHAWWVCCSKVLSLNHKIWMRYQGRSRWSGWSGHGLTTFSATFFYYCLPFKVTAPPPYDSTLALHGRTLGQPFKSRLRPWYRNAFDKMAKFYMVCAIDALIYLQR